MAPATARAFVIGVLGAESTGKSTLAAELRDALALPGRTVALVPEVLRGFCDRHGRTPHRNEQPGIAAEQTRRIAQAASAHDVVIADTTALMTAVYSELVFGDTSLYARAEADHCRCDLTLLTALDLPWQADGLQRDGPQVREPVDVLIRAALHRAGQTFERVAGVGATRLKSALAGIDRAMNPPAPPALTSPDRDG